VEELMEPDPDPTDPIVSTPCSLVACACQPLRRSADAWHIAYEFVIDRDESDARVIDFVPPKVRRR
jgi:hypothetical protein